MEDPYLLEEILNDDKINEGNLDMMNIDKNLDDILNETTYTNTINLDDTNNNFTNNNNSNINNNIIINNNNYNIEKKQFFKSPLDFISQYEKNNYSPIPLPLNYLPLKSHSHSNFNPKLWNFFQNTLYPVKSIIIMMIAILLITIISSLAWQLKAIIFSLAIFLELFFTIQLVKNV